jgi:hypothetical protein
MFLSTMQLLLHCFTLFNLLWSSQIAHQIEFNQPYVNPAWFIQLPWKEPLAPAWLNLGIKVLVDILGNEYKCGSLEQYSTRRKSMQQ